MWQRSQPARRACSVPSARQGACAAACVSTLSSACCTAQISRNLRFRLEIGVHFGQRPLPDKGIQGALVAGGGVDEVHQLLVHALRVAVHALWS